MDAGKSTNIRPIDHNAKAKEIFVSLKWAVVVVSIIKSKYSTVKACKSNYPQRSATKVHYIASLTAKVK